MNSKKEKPAIPESYYVERRNAFRGNINNYKKYFIEGRDGVTYDGAKVLKPWNFIHIPKCAGTYFMYSVKPTSIPSPFKRHDNEIHSLGHGFNYLFECPGWNPTAEVFETNHEIGREAVPSLGKSPWMRCFEISSDVQYITIVRNPFDLLYSYWKYKPQDSSDWAEKDRPASGWFNCNNVMGTHTFDRFVEHYLDPQKEWHVPPLKYNLFAQLYRCPNRWQTTGQLCPIFDPNDWVRVPNLHVLRFENLHEDMSRWVRGNDDKMLFQVPEMAYNRSPKSKSYRQMYTACQVRRLKLLWKPQLEEFGYDY